MLFLLLVFLQGHCVDRQMSTPSLYSSLASLHGSVFYREKRVGASRPDNLGPCSLGSGEGPGLEGP